MSLLNRVYSNTLALLGISNNLDGRSFFEFSSKEKERIITEAAEEANRMQRELVEEYYKLHSSTKK